MGGLNLANHHAAVVFGILGNTISFMVYLAPLPTFYRIWKKKSTEGFQSVPYVVALFSAMLWVYYAFMKANHDYILLSINGFGCFIQTFYIVTFLVYAPIRAKVSTAKLLLLLNVGLFGLIVIVTSLLSGGQNRVKVLGWICVCFAVAVFAAPLSIISLVVRTKSVEYMPFSLSLFLTFNAIAWFCYGLFSDDIYVSTPNVLGFFFGMAQMILYACYMNTTQENKQTNDIESIIDIKPNHEKQEMTLIELKLDSGRVGQQICTIGSERVELDS